MFQEGESHYLKGLILVLCYAVISVCFFVIRRRSAGICYVMYFLLQYVGSTTRQQSRVVIWHLIVWSIAGRLIIYIRVRVCVCVGGTDGVHHLDVIVQQITNRQTAEAETYVHAPNIYMESVQYVLATEYSCTLLYYCLHKRRGSSTVASTGGGDETICLLEEAADRSRTGRRSMHGSSLFRLTDDRG